MTEMTPLDLAHAAMEAAPEDDAARLRFFERLADCELFILLDKEPEGDRISPEIFDTGEGRFVLVFDREERLAQFADRIVPYAALSGRVIAAMLAGQGIGLGVNLEVAPSSILIPDAAMGWLAETLSHAPGEVEAAISEVRPPQGLPEVLLTALDAKLATSGGLAKMAYLAAVTYEGGGNGHLLAFVGARPGSEGALAKAVGEALTFSGIEAGALDVGFFAARDEISARLSRVGLRFDLPEPASAPTHAPQMPGADPAKPPRLK
ncbi:SseB family protein [Epibacterium sp. Ofav1-8]|uniref:SseB family protein n=1 Tax=Epibacterium sp. Ofav1-8 TaxID=2917735 RepID=UPI001EF5E64E|nr:SseB family protein [Epibacterium sp. Ofav1-8]MCG7622913.1 SseB family protein [Epibacterium sp. Ofav1-8]